MKENLKESKGNEECMGVFETDEREGRNDIIISKKTKCVLQFLCCC